MWFAIVPGQTCILIGQNTSLGDCIARTALIKGMHARFTLKCNDTPRIAQLINWELWGNKQ